MQSELSPKNGLASIAQEANKWLWYTSDSGDVYDTMAKANACLRLIEKLAKELDGTNTLSNQ